MSSARSAASRDGRSSSTAAAGNLPATRASSLARRKPVKGKPARGGPDLARRAQAQAAAAKGSTPAMRSGQSTRNGSRAVLNGVKASSQIMSASKAAGDWQDRHTMLKRSREQERTLAIRTGLMADPEKPRSLADAITPVGTCQAMCPEFERVQRVVQKDVWDEETDQTHSAYARGEPAPDEARMVKKFRRSAAGYDEQLPSDLRPPHVLRRTCDYLFHDVIGNAKSLASVHHFVWDRTRAIRNDFSIQQVTKSEDLRVAIECYERIARFHIVSLHQLSLPKKPYDKYDAQQEREQLDRTLLSLMQYYDDSRGKVAHPNEAEFRAYCIIFQLQDPVPDLEDRVQSWPRAILNDPKVRTALEIYAAACSTEDAKGPLKPYSNHAIARQDWARFWKLISSNYASYLLACVAEIYFGVVRRMVLRAIVRTARMSKATSTNSEWTIDELWNVLNFDTETQLITFCERNGLSFCERDEDSMLYLDLSTLAGKALPRPSAGALAQAKSELVENKRHGRIIPALIDGLSVKQAADKEWIDEESVPETGFENENSLETNGTHDDTEEEEEEEEDEVDDEDEDEEQDSLFIPETASKKAKQLAPLNSTDSSAKPFSSFGQPSTSSTFGQSSTSAFGQPSTSAFGQPSTSAFGQSSTSASGQPNTSPFGQPSTSAFGRPSAPITSPFGGPSPAAASNPPLKSSLSTGQSSSGNNPSPAPSPKSVTFALSEQQAAPEKKPLFDFAKPANPAPAPTPTVQNAPAKTPTFSFLADPPNSKSKNSEPNGSSSASGLFSETSLGSKSQNSESHSWAKPTNTDSDNKPTFSFGLPSNSSTRSLFHSKDTASDTTKSSNPFLSAPSPFLTSEEPSSSANANDSLFKGFPASSGNPTTSSTTFTTPGTPSATTSAPSTYLAGNTPYKFPGQPASQPPPIASNTTSGNTAQENPSSITSSSQHSRRTSSDTRPKKPSPLSHSFSVSDDDNSSTAPTENGLFKPSSTPLSLSAFDAASAANTSLASITKPAPPDDAARLDSLLTSLAHDLTFNSHIGLLKQYAEFYVSQVITETQEMLYNEHMNRDADDFRKYSLCCRYGKRWREICRHQRLLRQGRARRQRAKRRLEEMESNDGRDDSNSVAGSVSALSSSRAGSVRNAQTNGRVQTPNKRHTVDAMFRSTIGGKSRFDLGRHEPSHNQLQAMDASQATRNNGTSSFHSQEPSNELNNDTASVKVNPKDDLLRRSSFLGFSLPSSETNRTSTTKTTYFRMKAMGIKPPPTSQLSSNSLKRARSGSLDVVSTRDPSPSAPAMPSASHRYSLDSALMPPPPSKRSRTKINDEDEALFARVRAARESLKDSMGEMKQAADHMAEELRRSKDSMDETKQAADNTPDEPLGRDTDSESSGETPYLDFARDQLQRQRARENLLGLRPSSIPPYRLRESKFVSYFDYPLQKQKKAEEARAAQAAQAAKDSALSASFIKKYPPTGAVAEPAAFGQPTPVNNPSRPLFSDSTSQSPFAGSGPLKLDYQKKAAYTSPTPAFTQDIDSTLLQSAVQQDPPVPFRTPAVTLNRPKVLLKSDARSKAKFEAYKARLQKSAALATNTPAETQSKASSLVQGAVQQNAAPATDTPAVAQSTEGPVQQDAATVAVNTTQGPAEFTTYNPQLGQRPTMNHLFVDHSWSVDENPQPSAEAHTSVSAPNGKPQENNNPATNMTVPTAQVNEALVSSFAAADQHPAPQALHTYVPDLNVSHQLQPITNGSVAAAPVTTAPVSSAAPSSLGQANSHELQSTNSFAMLADKLPETQGEDPESNSIYQYDDPGVQDQTAAYYPTNGDDYDDYNNEINADDEVVEDDVEADDEDMQDDVEADADDEDIEDEDEDVEDDEEDDLVTDDESLEDEEEEEEEYSRLYTQAEYRQQHAQRQSYGNLPPNPALQAIGNSKEEAIELSD